jgi:hypothetical protein
VANKVRATVFGFALSYHININRGSKNGKPIKGWMYQYGSLKALFPHGKKVLNRLF